MKVCVLGLASSFFISFRWLSPKTFVVYNHVLKLDLESLQWTLVDNYGDIPGVRMGKSNPPDVQPARLIVV